MKKMMICVPCPYWFTFTTVYFKAVFLGMWIWKTTKYLSSLSDHNSLSKTAARLWVVLLESLWNSLSYHVHISTYSWFWLNRSHIIRWHEAHIIYKKDPLFEEQCGLWPCLFVLQFCTLTDFWPEPKSVNWPPKKKEEEKKTRWSLSFQHYGICQSVVVVDERILNNE